MAIFANDLIGIDINQFGLYERTELELVFDFLEPLRDHFATGTALDIGGNIGNHALFFARLFRTVHSFEPNPTTYELLCFNARWVRNVQTHAVGLGDERGSFDLFEITENIGGSSIREGDRSIQPVVQIQVERLDDLDMATDALCFVKIDVEGFEPRVLRGAERTICKCQPLIMLEQHESEFVGGSTPSIEMLGSWGYRFCWQQPHAPAGGWLLRRWQNLREAFAGRHYAIATASCVPCINHSMLIAVPPRFQTALKLN
jgi:FkbM family methyltransferase